VCGFRPALSTSKRAEIGPLARRVHGPRFPVSEHHHGGNLGHLDQLFIVFRSDRIGNLRKALLAGGSVKAL
jgi:hypothetical protein